MSKTQVKELGERQKKIADDVLQEWRSSRGGRREPSGQKVAHDMVHRLFAGLPNAAFKVNSKEENA